LESRHEPAATVRIQVHAGSQLSRLRRTQIHESNCMTHVKLCPQEVGRGDKCDTAAVPLGSYIVTYRACGHDPDMGWLGLK
jgi:hypothetical protein